ncbi:MAG: hypothetical protein A2992_01585 [Elusimicrobia bacterium RIFCSPLOWO2_01_FULL_59_12]|nr:MAG: hypothetical protein A2992_01585 [Elusimicrobia bacterium RIFCSPLOWO2_01_FULL_59_12]
MKKNTHKRTDAEMLPEYDFHHGVRGKHAKRYAEGTNIVALDPVVAEYFPTAESVNRALRALAEIIRFRKKKTA